MMEGTIVQWAKKEGDPIQPGDVLCDIQTDKAVVAMDIEEEGTLAKILVCGVFGTQRLQYWDAFLYSYSLFGDFMQVQELVWGLK